LGRRDSLTASRTLANQNLPSPSSTLTRLKEAFAVQGLDTTDLIALSGNDNNKWKNSSKFTIFTLEQFILCDSISGAHTFGRAHCSLILDRLYNFDDTGKPDPTLDTAYLQELRKICPQGGPNNLVNFEPTNPDKFDLNFYYNLQNKMGLLQSDQVLFSTPGADTINIVNNFSSNQNALFNSFATSMIKMGNIGVLTGKEGEIRKHCNWTNAESVELYMGSVTSESEEGLVGSI